eukprot:m.103097 g.103097  ORF g.103097 m.103097 type:complete len:660 (+) comp10466_c0_seq1:1379-3358(+)
MAATVPPSRADSAAMTSPLSQQRWHRWRHRGAPRTVVTWIRHGIRIPWLSAPPPIASHRPASSPASARALDDLIEDLLRRGILIRARPTDHTTCIMPAWAEPKLVDGTPSGKYRFILDCRHVNEYVQPQPTRTEGLRFLPQLTCPGDHGCVQDMESFYFQFPLHRSEWHRFGLRHRGVVYHMTRLPMGFTLSQMYVVKATRWIIQALRAQGLRLLQYTDDFSIFAPPTTLPRHLATWLEWMHDLGLPVSPTKGFREGRQRFVLLGLGVDLALREFFVPAYKVEQLRHRIQRALHQHAHHGRVSRRQLACVIGTAISLVLAVPTMPLWLASLHAALGLPPDAPLRHAWNGTTSLSHLQLSDLRTLLALPPEAMHAPWAPPAPTVTAASDASTTGYGAHAEGLPDVAGHWPLSHTHRDIAMLEMRAVRLAMEAWRDHLHGTTVLWWTDNTTVLRALNHHACRSHAVMDEYRDLFPSLQHHHITIHARWLASATNDRADALSRRQDPLDYGLRLRHLCPSTWPQPTHDRFASASHHQPDLPYDSRTADGEAATTDTMTTTWTGISWLTPPLNFIANTLAKLDHDAASAIILVPTWPAQPWWPQYLRQRLDYIDISDIAPHIITNPNNAAIPEVLRNRQWHFQLAWVRGTPTSDPSATASSTS